MRTLRLLFAFVIVCFVLFSSCQRREDVGPKQEGEVSFELTDFDKLEMGSAFVIEVLKGTAFSVTAKGDQRNLNDLDARVINGELRIDYRNNRNRQYTTFIYIVMPSLKEINFSGASDSRISGFSGEEQLSVRLSGASRSKINHQAQKYKIDLSGASNLYVEGSNAQSLEAKLSGASLLNAYSILAQEVYLDASGASDVKVSVVNKLKVTASGASNVRYRGNPGILETNLSGASNIFKE